MSMPIMEGPQHHILYQADPHTVHNLKSVRERVQHLCRQHAGKAVRIQTMDGHVYEGVLVSCGNGLLYLKVTAPATQRNFLQSYYYNTVILPLVLYELLVITLLYL